MKIVIVAPFVSESNYKLLQTRLHIINPGQKFYMLLYKGLVNNDISTSVFSIIPEQYKPYIQEDDFVYFYKTKNKFGLTRITGATEKLSEMVDENTVIIADGEAYWTLVVSLKQKCKVINLITDFPHHVASYSSSMSSRSCIYRKIYQIYAKHKLSTFKKADGFIFLTEQMSEIIGTMKPHIVIEGFTDSEYKDTSVEHNNSGIRTISYLGALNDKSGIMMLIEAFRFIHDDSLRLDVYGTGNYVDSIMKCDDVRIRYKGSISLDEVEKVEKESDFLINPRPSKDEFNKYSFPSKTLEYMLSGTPVMTTRLAGIPEEYDDFLYYIEDSSAKRMADSIIETISWDKKDLEMKGIAAKRFALNSKNNVVQANKILSFCSSL